MQSPQQVGALKIAGLPFASPSVILGLIDTGASNSALDRHIITLLGLQCRGIVSIHTPSTGSGYEVRNQFDVCFILGETENPPLSITLPVVESDFASQGFYALIGRDVLDHCTDFNYKGSKNTFTLSY
jgi:hypothetical protein